MNADYYIKGEISVLKPPNVHAKAGLVEPDEYWLVKKAIYGLRESPLRWSNEREANLTKMIIEVPRNDCHTINDKYFLTKPQGDPNTWRISKEGVSKKSQKVCY